MERIRIDRHQSLRAQRRRTREQAEAAAAAPLVLRGVTGPGGDNDLLRRIDRLLEENRATDRG